MSGPKRITSYGVILFTIEDGVIYYLLGQRRDTIEYVDSIKFRFPVNKLSLWMSLMTKEEKLRIKSYDFKTLWKDLTLRKDFETDYLYIRSKNKFENNKQHIFDSIDNSKTFVKEPSWGFPKGRKNAGETYISCALREFEEETKLSSFDIHRFKNESFSEYFNGSDRKKYTTHYYLFQSRERLKIKYTKCDSPIESRQDTVSAEFQNVGWFTFEECIKKVNPRRATLLKKINTLIMKTMDEEEE